MSARVRTAFDLQGLRIPLQRILPLKKVVAEPSKNSAFRRVLASVKEVGLIEPLVVFPRDGFYTLLDGHLRLEALRQLGETHAACLVSADDEAFTYNHKVNVVPPIQEHFMIMRAIESGVSEEKIAKTLDVDVTQIRQKRDLLNGICPEAVELLRHKTASRHAIRQLRKVRPMRQIEIAELMVTANNYTAAYAKGLVAATPDVQLTDPEAKAPRGLSRDEVARMERELETLEKDFRGIQETYHQNTLHLVLVSTYVRKLVTNAAVAKFLSMRYADILAEFRKLADVADFDEAS